MRLSGTVALVGLLVVGCGSAVVPEPKAAPPSASASVAAVEQPAAEPPPAEFLAAEAPRAQTDIDVTPSRTLVASDRDDELTARVRVVGLPLADARRPTMNIALVVDTSRSMEGAGISRAREACGALIDALQPGDVLSIVTFGSQPRLVFEASRISAETRALARKALEAVRADGTTDLSGGLRMGIEQAKLFLRADGVNRVVLLGDGSPNDPSTVLPLADQARSLRLPVTVLGLGPDFDETLMTGVAQRSGGTFHFVEDARHVTTVFEQQIGRMERLVAKNAWLEITPGPGVMIDEAIGLPGTRVGRTLRVALGDITEGQVRDALVKVRVTGKQREGAAVELLDAVVHYTLPTRNGELTASKFASVEASGNASKVKASSNVEVERQATRLRVADNLVRAIGMARNGDVIGARKLLDASRKLATEAAKRFDDVDLLAKAKEIAALRKTIATLAPAPIDGSFGMRPVRPTMRGLDPASPASAMSIRKTHSAAMSELHGN